MRELAQKLLVAGRLAADLREQEAALVNENLRQALMQLVGHDGYIALLRRALTLASVEVPALQSAKIGADGHIEGIEQLFTHAGAARDVAAVAVTAQVLELLLTFVGERLTRAVVRMACPEALATEQGSNTRASQ